MDQMTQQSLERKPEVALSDWEKNQAKYARHRALIMQILTAYPEGLTVQEVVAKEIDFYGYSFLTDNRLRELRAKGWAESFGESPMKWRIKA
jgi:hypothetical protein